MTTIAIIGTGNMGSPMSINLCKAGFTVNAYDIVEHKLDALVPFGVNKCSSHQQALVDVDFVVTMLPSGKEVHEVYHQHVLQHAPKEAKLIDCSTIDLTDATHIHETMRNNGFSMLDAPVSGGTVGAANGTLTFMVGGAEEDMQRAEKLFTAMGKHFIHCGDAGMGQAAKMCNNMMLGIQMASVAEGFKLAAHCGLSDEKLFEVASQSSGNCFALQTFCPIPDIVPTSPSSNHYEPGFSAALMLKDMNLALNAAQNAKLDLATAKTAHSLYDDFNQQGQGDKDFSAIYTSID